MGEIAFEMNVWTVEYPATAFVQAEESKESAIRVIAFPGVVFVTPGLLVNGVFFPLKTDCIWLRDRPELYGLYNGQWNFEMLAALVK